MSEITIGDMIAGWFAGNMPDISVGHGRLQISYGEALAAIDDCFAQHGYDEAMALADELGIDWTPPSGETSYSSEDISIDADVVTIC